jgi:hypothetical protein
MSGMIYNIHCYGKKRTSRVSYNDAEDARKYLKKKSRAGFVLLRNVAGGQSELALNVWDGRCNICIEESSE